MELETFVKQAAYIVCRACDFSEKARREGLPALEESIDAQKADIQDVFEYGIRLAVDGADELRINEALSGLIDGERDEDARRLKTMQKEAVLSIHAGENTIIVEFSMVSRISDRELKAMQKLLPDAEMPEYFSSQIAAASEAEEKTGVMGPGDFIEQLARVTSRAHELHIKAVKEGLLAIEDDLFAIENYIKTTGESFGAPNTMRRHIFVSGLRLTVDGTEDHIIDRILSNLIAHERDDKARRLKTIMKEAVLCIQNGCHRWTLLSTIFFHIDDSELADLRTALSDTDVHADMEPAMKMAGITRHTEADNYYATVLNVGRELGISPEAYLPEVARGLHWLVRPQIEERRYEEAKSIHAKLREVCQELPSEAEYYFSEYAQKCDRHGIAHYEQGQYDLAIEDFDESLKFKPESASTHCWRGNAYYKQGRYDSAVADFTEAIRLDPDSASYYSQRGDAYYKQSLCALAEIKDFSEAIRHLAIKDFSEAIKLDPDSASYYSQRGNAYYNQERYDLAVADFTEAIRLDPDSAWYYSQRGDVYYKQFLYDLAIEDFSEAIKLDPNNSTYSNNCANVHYLRGYDYSQQFLCDLAIKDFSEAIRLKPNGKDAYNDRAKTYNKMGLYELAEKDLARVASDETQWAITEVLSWHEIEQLLILISAKDTEPKALPLDNKRYADPENLLLKSQMEALSTLFGTFAQLTASGFSNKLRLPVHVSVSSASLLAYEELIRSISVPTIFATVGMEPLKRIRHSGNRSRYCNPDCQPASNARWRQRKDQLQAGAERHGETNHGKGVDANAGRHEAGLERGN